MNLKQKFKIYDATNPQVWEEFEKLADLAVSKGRTVLSARLILEGIRWNTYISGNDDYKINNNYHAFYARKWNEKHIHVGAEFRTRTQRYQR